MIATYKLILSQQQAWAKSRGIKFDSDGYTLALSDNLFCPLSLETKREFDSGQGDELGKGGSRGKMQALHSSSALVVNVFEYWRNHSIATIAKFCGLEGIINSMEFEKTHPIKGVARTPPHLDVEFTGPIPLAIESKFTETYRRKTRRDNKDTHLDIYLEHRDIWNGIPKAKALAKSIVQQSGVRTDFEYLDVPQLLKHILGLATKFGATGFELLYLWYDLLSLEAKRHRRELIEFKEQIAGEVYFRDITYQELFEVIKRSPETDKNYISYLAARYFL